MSILVTGGLLVLAIVLLAVNLAYITFALYNLGISNLFKTVEDVFTGKNKGATGEDFLIYAGLISLSVFVVFAIVIVVAIIIAVAGAPEEAGAAVGGEVAEEAASEFIPGVGKLVGDAIGIILLVILVAVVFASTSSGILCIVAASRIKKEKDFNKERKLRKAYTDAIIAGIVGISIAAFALLSIIGYFVYYYYKKREIAAQVAEAKKKEIEIKQLELKGERKLLEEPEVKKELGQLLVSKIAQSEE